MWLRKESLRQSRQFMFINVAYEDCHDGLWVRKWAVNVTLFVQLMPFLFIPLMNAGGEMMVGELDHVWK